MTVMHPEMPAILPAVGVTGPPMLSVRRWTGTSMTHSTRRCGLPHTDEGLAPFGTNPSPDVRSVHRRKNTVDDVHRCVGSLHVAAHHRRTVVHGEVLAAASHCQGVALQRLVLTGQLVWG